MSPAAIMTAAAAWTALCVSFLLSRSLAETEWLQDRPNERSAHFRSTPRSGGVAIFAGWTSAILILILLSAISGMSTQLMMLALAAFVAFAVGLADDHLSLPPIAKLAGQALAAGLFLFWFEPAPLPFIAFLGDPAARVLEYGVTMFAIVAFMNAYNFMDGVNGLAASCGAFVMAALAVVAVSAGDVEWSLPALMLAVAIFGFLPTNLRSGTLFMGDAGSQFIGFLVAALAILCATADVGAVSALFVPTAFMPFLFDVAITLVWRAAHGRNVFSAHREHLYQRLFLSGAPHSAVTAIYLCLTALSTAAAMATTLVDGVYQLIPPIALAVAFTPLAFFAYRISDRREESERAEAALPAAESAFQTAAE